MKCQVKTKLLLLAACILILCSCSRPQKVVEPPSKASADATLRLANSLEQRYRFQDAKQSYENVYTLYRSFADAQGMMQALSGLARIALHDDQFDTMNSYRTQMQQIVFDIDKETACILLLFDILVLHSQERYQEILTVAEDSFDYPIGIRMQILTHRLQAESYLKPGFSYKTVDDLERLSSKYKKHLSSDLTSDPIVLANAYYALAYHNMLTNKQTRALQYINDSIKLDYLHESFPSLAYSYWLRGIIQTKSSAPKEALASYSRSREIFSSYGNHLMVDKINDEINHLKGK